jgi:hypothetical protein
MGDAHLIHGARSGQWWLAIGHSLMVVPNSELFMLRLQERMDEHLWDDLGRLSETELKLSNDDI